MTFWILVLKWATRLLMPDLIVMSAAETCAMWQPRNIGSGNEASYRSAIEARVNSGKEASGGSGNDPSRWALGTGLHNGGFNGVPYNLPRVPTNEGIYTGIQNPNIDSQDTQAGGV